MGFINTQLATSRTDTFTAAGNGITVDSTLRGVGYFSIQVTGQEVAATAWNVVLEGSLYRVNFSTILTHTEATGDGEVLFSGANVFPSVYFRSRLVSVTLGSAVRIVVNILGF